MLQFKQPIELIKLADAIGAELTYISEFISKNFSNDTSNIINVGDSNHAKNLLSNNQLDNQKHLENKFIDSVATIDVASLNQITFLANPLYSKYLNSIKASAIIIEAKYLKNFNTANAILNINNNLALLLTNNPRLALAKLLNLCAVNKVTPYIHSSCIIGTNVQIGKEVTIEPGVIIGNNCVIGDRTVIKANVVLYDKVTIGSDCIIHSNTVIGADGFGYAQESSGKWIKMPHLGGVIIENQVEIGSNTSIDRGCIGDTIIKTGVIIDNLVQIAHNVIIGKYTAIAGCTAIAGSTIIGNNCLIGGASNIAGHLTIADHICITATSTVTKSLLKKGIYSSVLTVKDNLAWKRNLARFNSLDETLKKIFNKIN